VILGRHQTSAGIPESLRPVPRDANRVYEVASLGGNDILRPSHPATPACRGRVPLYSLLRGRPPSPRFAFRCPLNRPFETAQGHDRRLGWSRAMQWTPRAGAVEFEVEGQPRRSPPSTASPPGSPAHPVQPLRTSGFTHVPGEPVAAGGRLPGSDGHGGPGLHRRPTVPPPAPTGVFDHLPAAPVGEPPGPPARAVECRRAPSPTRRLILGAGGGCPLLPLCPVPISSLTRCLTCRPYRSRWSSASCSWVSPGNALLQVEPGGAERAEGCGRYRRRHCFRGPTVHARVRVPLPSRTTSRWGPRSPAGEGHPVN